MVKVVKDNITLFIGLFLAIIDLSFVFLALEKNAEIGTEVFLVVVLIALFWYFSPYLIDLMTDIIIPKFLQGRTIYVDTEGGYEILKNAGYLATYLTGKGADIIGEERGAEFRILLKPDSNNSSMISCSITGSTGCQ